MPAAHQRRAMSPLDQFFTLAEWSRQISIMDSIVILSPGLGKVLWPAAFRRGQHSRRRSCAWPERLPECCLRTLAKGAALGSDRAVGADRLCKSIAQTAVLGLELADAFVRGRLKITMEFVERRQRARLGWTP